MIVDHGSAAFLFHIIFTLKPRVMEQRPPIGQGTKYHMLALAALERTCITSYFSQDKASHVDMPEHIILLQGGAPQDG